MSGPLRLNWMTLAVVLLSVTALQWTGSAAAVGDVVEGFGHCKVASVSHGAGLLTHATTVTTDRGRFTVYGVMPVATGDDVSLHADWFGRKSLCDRHEPAGCFRLSAE